VVDSCVKLVLDEWAAFAAERCIEPNGNLEVEGS
jgi:hypothetical protein